MGGTSESTMSSNPESSPGLADPAETEVLDAELEEQGPSPAVAEVLALAAELGLTATELLELALCAIDEVAADLAEDLDELSPQPVIVATIERCGIAAEVLSGVALDELLLHLDQGEEEDDEAQAA